MKAFLIISLLLTIGCKEQTPQVADKENVSVAEAAKLFETGYKYIDVRTDDEIKSTGLINNAINIDYKSDDFDSKVSQLSKDEKYILYCRSGRRSSNSLKTFKKYDLHAVNMQGGFNEWSKTNK